MSRPVLSLVLLGVLAALPVVASLALDPAPRSPFRDPPPPLGELALEDVVLALPGDDGSELLVRGQWLGQGRAATGRITTLERALLVRGVELEAGDGSGDRWRVEQLQLRGTDRVEWAGTLERRAGDAWVEEATGRGRLGVAGGRPEVETYPVRTIRGPFGREE